MSILPRVQRPDPSPENPFAGDRLQREDFATALNAAITSIESPATLALIGPWGSGKTRFLKMVDALSKKNAAGPETIFFDAWASDYADDPFVAFCAGIERAMKSSTPLANAELSEEFGEKAKNVILSGTGITAKVLAPLIGGLLAHLIGADPVLGAAGGAAASKPFEKGIEKGVEKSFEIVADKIHEQAEKMPDARAEFKRVLGNAVNNLRERASEKEDHYSCQLLILVDELDRCRPDFAIRLLEVIKHFFDIPGITFLLAFDEDYLTSATRALYGASFDAERYLRRFVDASFWLPRADPEEYLSELVETYALGPTGPEKPAGYIIELAKALRLDLRDAQQAFAACKLLTEMQKGKVTDTLYLEPCYTVCLARYAEPELVTAILEGRKEFSTLTQRLHERFGEALKNIDAWDWMQHAFAAADTPIEQITRQPSNTIAAPVHQCIANTKTTRGRYGDAWRRWMGRIR